MLARSVLFLLALALGVLAFAWLRRGDETAALPAPTPAPSVAALDARGVLIEGESAPAEQRRTEADATPALLDADVEALRPEPGRCRLHGALIDQSGECVRDHEVWLQRTWSDVPVVFATFTSIQATIVRTDAQGRFAFDGLRPGRWAVGPGAERDEPQGVDPQAIPPLAQIVEILPGTSDKEVLLQVQRGLFITGKVFTAAGQLASDAYLEVESGGVTWPFLIATKRDGTFVVGPLAPGLYRVGAQGFVDAASEWVEAAAGETGVEVHLCQGASVRGTVLDASTGKGCVARISSGPPYPGERATRSGASDADGKFTLRGLRPGTYDLVAVGPHDQVGVLRAVIVTPQDVPPEQVLRLAPGAHLTVRFAGSEGRLQYRVLRDGVVVAHNAIEAGAKSEASVPTGKLLIEASWYPQQRQALRLVPAAGEQKELVFGGG